MKKEEKDFLQLPQIDVLAIGAHPDDIELHVGGTLVKLKSLGYKIGVLDMTKGEMGTRGTAEIRAVEAQNSAEILGLLVRHNLELQDGHIWCDEPSRVKLVRALRQLRPKIVFTHYFEDPHPDHAHTTQLVREAVHLSRMLKYDGDFGLPPHKVSAVAHFLFPRTVAPTFVVDISEHHNIKWNAVQAYGSQFYNPNSSEPETLLTGKSFFDQLQSAEKRFGLLIHVDFAEAFVIKEALNVDDPVTLLTRPMNPYN